MASDWFLEEYKLLQSKIDQVLTSQFQVRSWSVSLLTGFVLGVFATHTSPLALLIAVPIILTFQLQDKRQEWFRKSLSRRAADLESGAWEERYGHLRNKHELDVGLRLIVAELD